MSPGVGTTTCWTCYKCGGLVQYKNMHICPEDIQAPIIKGRTDIISILERIAIALEKIAEESRAE